MKKFLLLFTCVFLAACSSLMPYKDQNLDYLQGIEKDPNAYRGQVVSFGGEVAGITEDTLRMMLVMKIDAPLYYYATGKGNSLSYEMLLVTFNKRGMPQMTGIKKGNTIKVLARVSSYETRKNFTGDDIAVLHLIAFAVSDHTQHKDFFRPETPDRQLYESWKEGRLFFEESAQDVINRCPKENTPQLPEHFFKQPAATQEPPAEKPAEPEKGIVFDEEEPTFVLDPQPTVCPEQEPAPSAAPQPDEKAPSENENRPASESAEQTAAPADGDGAAAPATETPNTPLAANETSAQTPAPENVPTPADVTRQQPEPDETTAPATPAAQSASAAVLPENKTSAENSAPEKVITQKPSDSATPAEKPAVASDEPTTPAATLPSSTAEN